MELFDITSDEFVQFSFTMTDFDLNSIAISPLWVLEMSNRRNYRYHAGYGTECPNLHATEVGREITTTRLTIEA